LAHPERAWDLLPEHRVNLWAWCAADGDGSQPEHRVLRGEYAVYTVYAPLGVAWLMAKDGSEELTEGGRYWLFPLEGEAQ
jgi:hypothetical protein